MGLFATGTSCLALVWVMGRSRVPAPPDVIRPFMACVYHCLQVDTPTCRDLGTWPRSTPSRRPTGRPTLLLALLAVADGVQRPGPGGRRHPGVAPSAPPTTTAPPPPRADRRPGASAPSVAQPGGRAGRVVVEPPERCAHRLEPGGRGRQLLHLHQGHRGPVDRRGRRSTPTPTSPVTGRGAATPGCTAGPTTSPARRCPWTPPPPRLRPSCRCRGRCRAATTCPRSSTSR